jgi:hypothetical protein
MKSLLITVLAVIALTILIKSLYDLREKAGRK